MFASSYCSVCKLFIDLMEFEGQSAPLWGRFCAADQVSTLSTVCGGSLTQLLLNLGKKSATSATVVLKLDINLLPDQLKFERKSKLASKAHLSILI